MPHSWIARGARGALAGLWAWAPLLWFSAQMASRWGVRGGLQPTRLPVHGAACTQVAVSPVSRP